MTALPPKRGLDVDVRFHYNIVTSSQTSLSQSVISQLSIVTHSGTTGESHNHGVGVV